MKFIIEYIENNYYMWPVWFLWVAVFVLVLKTIITTFCRIELSDIKKAQKEITRLERFIKSSESYYE